MLTILGLAFWSTEHSKYCASPRTVPIRAPSLPHTGKFLRKKKKFAFLSIRCRGQLNPFAQCQQGGKFITRTEQDLETGIRVPLCWHAALRLSGWDHLSLALGSLTSAPRRNKPRYKTWSRWDLSVCWIGGKEKLFPPSLGGGETRDSFRDKLYSFTRQPLSELFLIVYEFRHGPLHAPHSLQPDRDPATRSSPIPASWHCGDERCPQCPARGHLRASCLCCHQLAATHTAGYPHPHGLVGFFGVSS